MKIDKAGHACVKLPAADDYQVVSLRVRRGPVVRPPVDLHIAGGRAPHLVGLERHKP